MGWEAWQGGWQPELHISWSLYQPWDCRLDLGDAAKLPVERLDQVAEWSNSLQYLHSKSLFTWGWLCLIWKQPLWTCWLLFCVVWVFFLQWGEILFSWVSWVAYKFKSRDPCHHLTYPSTIVSTLWTTDSLLQIACESIHLYILCFNNWIT